MLALLECGLCWHLNLIVGIEGSGKMKEVPGSHCMYEVPNIICYQYCLCYQAIIDLNALVPSQISRLNIFSFICCLKELVLDGLRFPVVGLNSPSTVSNVLLQQPGKLKAKQLREGEQLHEFRMNPIGDSSGLNLLAKQSITCAECCVTFHALWPMILLYDLFYILTTDIQTSSKRDCLYGWLIWLMTKPEFIKSEL